MSLWLLTRHPLSLSLSLVLSSSLHTTETARFVLRPAQSDQRGSASLSPDVNRRQGRKTMEEEDITEVMKRMLREFAGEEKDGTRLTSMIDASSIYG